jgi:hypothetical protein
VDDHAAVAQTCGVTGVPAVAVLSPEGKVLAREPGPDREDLERLFGKFMTSK